MTFSQGGGGKRDEELVRACQQGNDQAFEELVKCHMEKAVQIAYNAVGNYEDARDISQDAFVKAHRSLKNFDLKSKFSTWFYRILMNTAKDFHRKKKWKTFLGWKTAEEHDRYFENIEDSHSGADGPTMNDELAIKMQEAIKVLPEKQKWIFTLRYIEGLSIREISEVTKLTGGTVKATLHFAAKKFKAAMEKYREGDG